MNRINSKYYLGGALMFLIVVGALFRLYRLNSLPGVLNRDEASIGYSAYSVLHTGYDERGQGPYPLNFISFGDYKLPGLIYSTIPSIILFGLSPFSTRLPTVFFSLLAIPGAYLLTRSLSRSRIASLITAGLVTFSLFHITQSRGAYEPIVGLTFSIWSFWAWLKGDKKGIWKVVSILLLLVGSFYYNTPVLILPLVFFLSTFLSSLPKRSILNRQNILSFFGLVIAILVITLSVGRVNQSRTRTIVFFNPDVSKIAWEQRNQAISSGLPVLVAQLAYNKHTLGLIKASSGYLSSFDPTYLWFFGDHNPWHNLRNINYGNLNPVTLFWFVLGLFWIYRNFSQHHKPLTYLFVYLFVSPIPNALTIDAPITNRLLDFHLAVLIISALGLTYLINLAKQTSKLLAKVLLISSLVAYLGIFTHFAISYLYSFNPSLSDSWNPGAPELIQKTEEISKDYDRVYVTNDFNMGHIFYAFYTGYDPSRFQTEAKWREEGLNWASEFGPYVFDTFPRYTNLTINTLASYINNGQKTVLAIYRGQPDEVDVPVFTVTDYQGNVLWYGVSISASTLLANINRQPILASSILPIKLYLESCKRGHCQPLLLNSELPIDK